MTSTERTLVLVDFFEQQQKKQQQQLPEQLPVSDGRASPTAKLPSNGTANSAPSASASSSNPLREAVHVTTLAQTKAAATARRRIDETMSALDSFSPFSTARVEGHLLLSEAELMSVSATLTELAASLEKAKEELSTRDGSATGLGLSVPTQQLLDHLCEALAILRSRNVHWREMVALCKEELALYRTQMHNFARCGILSCEPEDVPDAGRGSGAQHPSDHHTFDNKRGIGGTGEGHIGDGGSQRSKLETGAQPASSEQPRFGLFSGVAKNVMQLDSLLKGAVPGDGSGLSAPGGIERYLSEKAATLLGQVTPFSGDPTPNVVAVERLLPPLSSNPPQPKYSEEEKRELDEQHLSLIHAQREASANDAKAIEASVRELSQLTSLMNEKVAEQHEHFSILMRNTSEAKNHYDKALGELGKAEEGGKGLNSTRQLIALLWCCTIVLLVANWMMR